MRDGTGPWRRFIPVAAVAVSVAVFALVGCRPPGEEAAPTFAPPPTRRPTQLETHAVARGRIEEVVQTRGRVESAREERLLFRVGGRLEAIHVTAGEAVEEGALLAELYAADVEQEVLDAEFGLEGAELDLEDAEAALEMLELRHEQAAVQMAGDDLLAPGIELQKAQVQLDQAEEDYRRALDRPWEQEDVVESYRWRLQLAEWNYQLAEARMAAARRGLHVERIERTLQEIARGQAERRVKRAQRSVERAEARVDAASRKLSDTKLVAPFSGIVVSIDRAVGDQVASFELIGTLADPAELQIVTMVFEEEVSSIVAGARAWVRLDPFPNRTFDATVQHIASEAIVWQGRAAHEVRVAFDEGQDVPTAFDLGAMVQIAGRSLEDVLLIPERTRMAIGDRSYVEVVGGDGEVERVEIEIGLSDGEYVEVTAGLQEGQEIVIP